MTTANVKASGKSNSHKDHEHGHSLIVIKPSEKHSVMFMKCLPDLQANLFAYILFEASTQLRLLSECNSELRIMKTLSDMDHLLALKFHVHQGNEGHWLDKISQADLGCIQYKLDKLFADRAFLAEALQNTLVDLYANNCFNSLKATNKEIEDTALYRANLIEEEARNKINRRESSRQLRQHRNYIKTVLYDTNLKIEHLKCQVEDTEINSQTRSRYIVNWEVARTEQHDQKILEKESGISDSITYYQKRSDQEQRIHAEVELLVNISINETLMKVEHWMNKFEIDMEAQDLKIAKIKNKYQDVLYKRQQLEETYATHETLMKNWLKFKAERQEALEYWNKMQNSAIIVQAWWRGLLVRLEMGPYKPKRRPRAAAAEKDKKKKK